MKQLHLARVIIVSTHVERAEAIAAELADWGLAKATVLSDPAHVAERLAMGVDALVVDNEDAPPGALRNEMGVLIPPPGLAEARTPSLLLLARPTRSAVMSANVLGYGAVIANPAPARVIYRRLGAMLQRTRRAAREEELAPSPQSAARRAAV